MINFNTTCKLLENGLEGHSQKSSRFHYGLLKVTSRSAGIENRTQSLVQGPHDLWHGLMRGDKRALKKFVARQSKFMAIKIDIANKSLKVNQISL